MNECNCHKKKGKKGIKYNTKPYYEMFKEEHLIELLKLIVQLPIIDLGAQLPDKGIPCYSPFHQNFDHLRCKQNMMNCFTNSIAYVYVKMTTKVYT